MNTFDGMNLYAHPITFFSPSQLFFCWGQNVAKICRYFLPTMCHVYDRLFFAHGLRFDLIDLDSILYRSSCQFSKLGRDSFSSNAAPIIFFSFKVSLDRKLE